MKPTTKQTPVLTAGHWWAIVAGLSVAMLAVALAMLR